MCGRHTPGNRSGGPISLETLDHLENGQTFCLNDQGSAADYFLPLGTTKPIRWRREQAGVMSFLMQEKIS